MKEALTTSEWMVMEALWEQSPLTHSGLIKAIGDKVTWKYTTFGTYLNVLTKKGFVRFEKLGRDKLYYPALSREECISLESSSIINKVHKSSLKDLVMCMVEQGELDDEENRELLQLFQSLVGGEKK